MHSVRTLDELIHAVMNSLSLISSNSQYLLGDREVTAEGAEALQDICNETDRIASLLRLVPRELAKAPIPGAAEEDPRPEGRCEETPGTTDHGKGQR